MYECLWNMKATEQGHTEVNIPLQFKCQYKPFIAVSNHCGQIRLIKTLFLDRDTDHPWPRNALHFTTLVANLILVFALRYRCLRVKATHSFSYKHDRVWQFRRPACRHISPVTHTRKYGIITLNSNLTELLGMTFTQAIKLWSYLRRLHVWIQPVRLNPCGGTLWVNTAKSPQSREA